jgi:molybdopterin adenylyltransferase
MNVMDFRAAVITVSDGVSAGTRDDASGDVAQRLLSENGFAEIGRITIPDEHLAIVEALRLCAEERYDLVVTTGGTGFGPRDVTPEATRAVIEREAPGLAELMRAEGIRKTPMAALSRGIAGTIAGTLVLNLPGSPKAVEESLGAVLEVLPHALETLTGHTRHD